MNIHSAFPPGRWLKAADLQGRSVRVVIESCELEELPDGEQRPVLRFRGKEAGLSLNKTNAATLADALGPETERWLRQAIVLYPDETDLRGRRVACIRVRCEDTGAPAAWEPPPSRPARPIDEDPDDIPF
jgi:hypothetical protein